MNPFASFPDYYRIVNANPPNNEQILQVTKVIKDLEILPGYSETLLNMLIETNDVNFQAFLAIAIKNQVKQYWENEQLYSNKETFRNNLLQVMLRSSQAILRLISETITIISQYDFPDKWPQLMSILTSSLNNAQFPTIYAILFTSTQILKKYEMQSSSDPVFREIDNIVDYWGNVLITLLSDTLHKQNACPELEECFNFCFQIIKSLCSIDMPKFFYANLDKFLTFYHTFFNIPGAVKIKITLCIIMKQHIIRYLHEIKRWGQSEEDKRTPEEVQNVQQLWILLYTDLLSLMNTSDTVPDQLVIAVFDALTALARSIDKGFLVNQANLENFCLKTLIPCVSLSDDDISDFFNDSLDYFKRDIEGLESESKRMSAQNFLKILGRYFKNELASVFMNASQQLLATFNANPDQSWKAMDTAMFIMSIVIAKVTHYNKGVIEVIETVNLPQFLNSFIIPQLGSKFPLLQADALKFLVDFRNVIDAAVILQLFPNIANLLFLNQSPVPLYAAYFIERIMLCPQFTTDKGPILLANIDFNGLITRLFSIFNVNGNLNIIAPRCLMRLVVYGGTSIQQQIIDIISKCVQFLIEICKHPMEPFFNHYLFEIIVASVTKVKVPVPQIEKPVISLLDVILSNDVSEFIPYVYQIIGCFLFNYPQDAMNDQSFYAQHFTDFLIPQKWMSFGNIPALAILMRAYCIRLPQLVAQNIQPLFVICENLLQGTRSHPHAFMIFVSIIRFLPKDFVFSILPQMYLLVFNQLPNPNLKKYRQSYAVFMANACFFLGPDNALRFLGQNAEVMIKYWGESLPLVRGRSELECAISGCMSTLLTATVLNQAMWEQLFVGTVKMIESPSYDSIKEDIDVIRIEENDAKQFDTNFNKLVYAEEKEINPHPELENKDIVEYMATNFAKYSHLHPGYLGDCITRNLEPHLQTAFAGYQQRYNIQFE